LHRRFNAVVRCHWHFRLREFFVLNGVIMASHDKNENILKKQLLEMEVFKRFVAVCPLPLLPDTATNRPEPEPDIRCSLKDGTALAFELGECADVTAQGTKGNVVAVTAVENTDWKLQRTIGEAYNVAVKEGRIVDAQRFDYHTIEVNFEEGASLHRCQKAIPRIIETLSKHGPGEYLVGSDSIRCTVWGTSGSYKGPEFYCNGTGLHVGVYVVERIKSKLEKSYTTDAPIHLLSWSQTASAEELAMLGKDRELADFLKTNSMGPFARVWVFGLGENAIAFDSAAE
jgi:hypothetical protein